MKKIIYFIIVILLIIGGLYLYSYLSFPKQNFEVILLSPTKDTVWKAGETEQIKWQVSDNSNPIISPYLTDEQGKKIAMVGYRTATTLDWEIPKDFQPGAYQLHLRWIAGYEGPAKDILTSEKFQIKP